MKDRHFKRKSITAITLTLALMVPSVSPVIAADATSPVVTEAVKFSDLKDSHWAYNNIQTLVGLNGIQGYPDGTFKPNGTITYAELANILLGSTGNDTTVPEGTKWAEEIMKKAYDFNLVNQKIVPLGDAGKPATREIMAVMLANSAKELRGESLAKFDPKSYVISYYILDFALTDVAYRDHVNQCVASGLIQGNELNQLKPQTNLTRAEAATVCERLVAPEKRLIPTRYSEKEPEYKIVAQGTNVRDIVKQESLAELLTRLTTGTCEYRVLENGDKFHLKLVRKISDGFKISYLNPGGSVILLSKDGQLIAAGIPHTSGDSVSDPFSVDLNKVEYFIFRRGFGEDDKWINYIVPNTFK